ncbi:L-fuculose-phosphate aldolase [Lysobacter ruishenii]|uniref:L-fuculose-phosphate aldolase n=2 Tax=Aerolutibacter ruishenii TaxID=686800 RepID=A0A562LWB8_9GAMM|nr:L-fuculose-phosphate aldolase [Lysobacter ruishenii]
MAPERPRPRPEWSRAHNALTAMHQTERAARQSLVDHCRAMSASGLSFNKSGNASVRWGGGLLITPTGRAYDQLQVDEIVYLQADGTCPPGQLLPSSEWRIHRDILQAFPDANGIMHLHSPHATALACLGLGIPAFHYMVAAAGSDHIPCAGYATFGTEALSANILKVLQGGLRACLMANHGLVAMGASLEDAYALAGEVENLARQYIIARSLGPTQDLPRDEMERVLEKFKTYGQQRDEA